MENRFSNMLRGLQMASDPIFGLANVLAAL